MVMRWLDVKLSDEEEFGKAEIGLDKKRMC